MVFKPVSDSSSTTMSLSTALVSMYRNDTLETSQSFQLVPRSIFTQLPATFFPGRDQYYRSFFFLLFLWVCCSGSTRRLNRGMTFVVILRSPGSNLRPLVYKSSGLTTAPRRLSVRLTITVSLVPFIPIQSRAIFGVFYYYGSFYS